MWKPDVIEPEPTKSTASSEKPKTPAPEKPEKTAAAVEADEAVKKKVDGEPPAAGGKPEVAGRIGRCRCG